MLEFSARDYIEISHQFGWVLAALRKPPSVEYDLSKTIQKLLEEANRLGLSVTREALGQMLLEMVKANPGKVTMTGEGDERTVRFTNTGLEPERMCHHIECVYSTLKAELRSIAFRIVPNNKTAFCDSNWLFDSHIYKNFPRAWQEFQCAGRCYAFGENTACAFHLQRALEWGLKSLAVDLGKQFDRNSWQRHLEDIDKALAVKYSTAAPRSKEQVFYSHTATHFGHMKVAWRNPTMHIEAKYDEKEAAYLLTTIEKFMTHLAENGLKEAQP
jgi:hypothetical protein